MKRAIIFTFAIGIFVAALVSVAHAYGWLSFAEMPLRNWAQRAAVPSREIGNPWQTLLVALISLATAWLTLVTARRHRIAWLLLAFAAEMLALVWVGFLYHLFFQPIPAILAATFAYGTSIGYLAWEARPRLPKPAPSPEPAIALPRAIAPKPVIVPQPKPVLKPTIFKPKIAKTPLPVAPVPAAPAPHEPEKPHHDETFAGAPDVFETTVLVCDLADKYDLADNLEPAAAARAIAKFDQRASELLLKAGAHLHKTDAEGVVALFGFPRPLPEHAEKAVRAGFELVRAFSEEGQGTNGDSASAGGAHIGISSGVLIVARAEGKGELLVVGEALELARRFCVANRFYGSRILIGPRTFEMASPAVVARPIDFLSGVTAQERHEIYEPMALAADAPAELLARRDSFWNGVVLYREKRWAEALGAFQKARGDRVEDDPPLNLYLRRLEPLALHFMESERE